MINLGYDVFTWNPLQIFQYLLFKILNYLDSLFILFKLLVEVGLYYEDFRSCCSLAYTIDELTESTYLRGQFVDDSNFLDICIVSCNPE